MNINLKSSIHNRFDIEVRDAKSGTLKNTFYAENVVLNNLWTRLISDDYTNNYFAAIQYGTGTGVPSTSDTQLFTFLGAKYASRDPIPVISNVTYDHTSLIDIDNGIYSITKSIRILETEANGSTITEIGIGGGTDAATLCTHAMIRDNYGHEVGIKKLNTDIITITATVFLRFQHSYQNGAIYFPTFIEDINRPDIYANYSGNLLTINGLLKLFCGIQKITTMNLPSTIRFYKGCSFRQGVNEGGSTPSDVQISKSLTRKYDVAAKTMTLSCDRIGASETDNISGIGSATISATGSDMGYISIDFSKIAHPSIISEKIGTGDGSTKNFKTKFPLVRPGAKVYKNGVAVTSGVNVITGIPVNNNIGPFLKCIGRRFFSSQTETPSDYYRNVGSLCPGTYTRADSYHYIFGQTDLIFENPYYESYGINSMMLQYGFIYVSNDMITWTLAASNNSSNITTTIPEQYANFRYWKFVTWGGAGYLRCVSLTSNALTNVTNVQFDVAPEIDEIITIDYDTDVIPKDENHVLDFSMSISFSADDPFTQLSTFSYNNRHIVESIDKKKALVYTPANIFNSRWETLPIDAGIMKSASIDTSDIKNITKIEVNTI